MKQILAALIALFPPGALAAPITFTGSGTFDRGSFRETVGSGAPIANPYDAPGADNAFSFSISFDPTAPDRYGGDPRYGVFVAVTGFTVSNGLCSVNAAGGEVEGGIVDIDTLNDVVLFTGSILPPGQSCVVNGLAFTAVFLEFQFAPDTLQSDALDPLSWPINDATVTLSLSFFQSICNCSALPRSFIIRRGVVAGDVNDLNNIAPVPVPAAAPLMLAGLGAMAMLRRRRRTAGGQRRLQIEP